MNTWLLRTLIAPPLRLLMRCKIWLGLRMLRYVPLHFRMGRWIHRTGCRWIGRTVEPDVPMAPYWYREGR